MADINELPTARLTSRRKGFKKQLTDFEKYIEEVKKSDITEPMLANLNARLNKLKDKFEIFDKIQERIECECLNVDSEYDIRTDCENRYYSIVAYVETLLDAKNNKKP